MVTMMACKLVDVGVDYLTLTAPSGGSGAELLSIGQSLLHVEHSTTKEGIQDASINGYRGEQCGRVFYGERDEGTIVRCSGYSADSLVSAIAGFTGQYRCSRIDIQGTGKFDFDHYYYAQQTAQKARSPSNRKSEGRQASVLYYDGGNRGASCSIGARSSARFIRIYDKTREQRGAIEPNMWRWEVEYKKPLSGKVLSGIVDNPNDREYIAAQVYAECDLKGVTPPWESLLVINHVVTSIPKSTLSRNLAWLRTVVAPMLRRLDIGGYTKEYMSALGLQESENRDSVG